MAKTPLHKLSKEELAKKVKSMKMMIGISIPLIVILFFFVFREYFTGQEIDWSIFTIAICTLGIPATVYPELKKVREELMSRG